MHPDHGVTVGTPLRTFGSDQFLEVTIPCTAIDQSILEKLANRAEWTFLHYRGTEKYSALWVFWRDVSMSLIWCYH